MLTTQLQGPSTGMTLIKTKTDWPMPYNPNVDTIRVHGVFGLILVDVWGGGAVMAAEPDCFLAVASLACGNDEPEYRSGGDLASAGGRCRLY